MRRSVLIAALFIVGLMPMAATAADDHVSVSADQLKWRPAPPAYPKGAEFAVVAGNPANEGLYVVRLRVPAGYKVLPHTHPNDENVTVLSGTLHLGMGSSVDANKADTLNPGGFVKVNKGMVHYAVFPEATIIQVHGQGPQGITYVNPADDPRKSN